EAAIGVVGPEDVAAFSVVGAQAAVHRAGKHHAGNRGDGRRHGGAAARAGRAQQVGGRGEPFAFATFQVHGMQAAGVLGALVSNRKVGAFTVAGRAVDTAGCCAHAPAVGPQEAAVVVRVKGEAEAGFLRGDDDVLAARQGGQHG